MNREPPTAAELVGMVHELTQPYNHTERHLIRRRKRQIARIYRTDHPSLLDQLRAAIAPGTTDDTNPQAAESRPPLMVGALDALTRIETQAAQWGRRLQLPQPRPLRTWEKPVDTLGYGIDLDYSIKPGHWKSHRDHRVIEHNIRQLTPHADGRKRLARDIERWWQWARIESQWDGRPRDLRDPCPLCGERKLRVAWDVTAAWCRAEQCGATWDAVDLHQLGFMLAAQRGSA